MALRGYAEVASVKFVKGSNTTKLYHFALYDHAVEVGDYALVQCSNSYGDGTHSVVKVAAITPVAEHTGTTPTAEIICKVDFGPYERRCAMRKEREALKKKMDKLVKSAQELVVYQTIASENAEMAEMLAAYRETLNV